MPLKLHSFNFEAAVCGGVPIIHSLHTDFLADEVTTIMGIMNGTVSLTTHYPSDSLKTMDSVISLALCCMEPLCTVRELWMSVHYLYLAAPDY